MSKSKVAPSEQLSMVIDPHRHLSHFGAEGRACAEGPRGRSPRSAPVAPGSAAAHNACLDQMPGGPLGEPTQQLRSVHILPSTRQQLLDLQGRGHPFEFGAQIVEKQQLDVYDRQQSVDGPRLVVIRVNNQSGTGHWWDPHSKGTPRERASRPSGRKPASSPLLRSARTPGAPTRVRVAILGRPLRPEEIQHLSDTAKRIGQILTTAWPVGPFLGPLLGE